MGLSVNLKTNKGINYDRKFNLGDGVSIYGKAVTLTGIINPGTAIRIELKSENGTSYFYQDTFTDIWGDYASWFRLPNIDSRLNGIVTASYPVSGQDKTVIPIAVGNVSPKSLPNAEIEFSLLNYLPIIAITLGGFLIFKMINE